MSDIVISVSRDTIHIELSDGKNPGKIDESIKVAKDLLATAMEAQTNLLETLAEYEEDDLNFDDLNLEDIDIEVEPIAD